MESEENRTDEYWMGVRDALRMVDSFLKWSNSNKDRAKPLEEFLYDGLVAAAKRCESCLHKQLGIKFSSEDSQEAPSEEPSFDSMPPSDLHVKAYEEEIESISAPPEIVLEPEGTDETSEVAVEIEPELVTSDDSVRIESMGLTDESLEEDTLDLGAPRDFSDDFELIEPDHLFVTPEEDGIETPTSEHDTKDIDTEDIVIDDSNDEDYPETPSMDEDAVTVERPKYAWESSSTESHEEPEAPPPVPEVPSNDEAAEEPKVWSPMDEPSPETMLDEDAEDEPKEPPPPPPPPESEESEEERRRRARRLFFGA